MHVYVCTQAMCSHTCTHTRTRTHSHTCEHTRARASTPYFSELLTVREIRGAGPLRSGLSCVCVLSAQRSSRDLSSPTRGRALGAQSPHRRPPGKSPPCISAEQAHRHSAVISQEMLLNEAQALFKSRYLGPSVLQRPTQKCGCSLLSAS